MVRYEFWSSGKQKKADISSISDLLSQLSSSSPKTSLSDLNTVSKHSKLILARTKDTERIVGMATLAIFIVPTGKLGRIEEVVVDKKFRRQGIGKLLVKKLIAEAKALGLKRVDLTSRPTRTAANKMYQKLGFFSVKTNVYRLKFDG
jgi:ribosomal protein S18 acetylase RimI-like enzyme